MPSSDYLAPAVIAAISGGIFGTFGGYVRDRATMHLQRRFDERQRLKTLESLYKGRMLEAALDWDRRMMQLYEGAFENLDPPDAARTHTSEYYYQSVIFRFLQLTAIARRVEAEAFYIDPKIAYQGDFDLLRYAKAMLWVMIHAEISPDDGQPGVDHFRSDAFRPLLDLCYSTSVIDAGSDSPLLPETRARGGELVFDLERYFAMLRLVKGTHAVRGYVEELLAIFDGVCPDDYEESGRPRRRWDRLIALHLLTLAFVESCGYAWHQRDVRDRVELATSMLLYPETLSYEFDYWLPRLGLETGMRQVQEALGRAARVHGSGDAASRAARVLDLVTSTKQNRETTKAAAVRARTTQG